MAAADCGSQRRFAVACSVLSRCVKAEAAGKMAAATAASTMLLMPGADVVPDVREEPEATPAGGAAQAQAQLTIMYGGRVLVFDDFPADRAAELVRVAAGKDVSGDGCGGLADLPVARKASLQRFMEKRRDRLGARAPYAGRRSSPAAAAKKGKEEKDAEVECWLGLGISGGCPAPARRYVLSSQRA